MRQRKTVCDALAYPPEVKIIGVNITQPSFLLCLYLVLECANRFLRIDVDRKHAIRIV